MTSYPLPSNPDKNSDQNFNIPTGDPELKKFIVRLSHRMNRDALIQRTTDELREFLKVDRVLLYYFYREWKGQVTFESLRSQYFSIVGSTGPDDCFNDKYAGLYQAGRVRAIPDIELEPIQECQRDFIITIQIRYNLVVPVLTSSRLWGLLIAHHCQDAHFWSSTDIEMMQKAAKTLANSPAIRDS